MKENKYKRQYKFQKKLTERQSEKIKNLETKIQELELKCKEKDELINSVKPFKDELTETITQMRKHKKEYKELLEELREMKEVIDQEVYKGRWRIIKLLIK